MAEWWPTSQPRAGGTLQARRRMAPRPRSRSTLTGTGPRRLQGPGARGPLGIPPARPRGAGRSPAAGRAGPPARQQLARGHWEPPLSRHGPSAPARPPLPPRRPPSTGPRALVAGRPGEAARAPASAPVPAPGRGGTAEGGAFNGGSFGEPHRRTGGGGAWAGRRWGRPGAGRGAGSRAARPAPGPAAESGSGPATPGASGLQPPCRAAFWPHGAPPLARSGGRGRRRWGLHGCPAGGGAGGHRRGRLKEKAGPQREAKSLQHPVFPGGLPSKY